MTGVQTCALPICLSFFPGTGKNDKRISHNRANTVIWTPGADNKGGTWADPRSLQDDYATPRRGRR